MKGRTASTNPGGEFVSVNQLFREGNVQHALISLGRVQDMLAAGRSTPAAKILDSGAAVLDEPWPEMAALLKIDSQAVMGAVLPREAGLRIQRHVDEALVQLRRVDAGETVERFPVPSDYFDMLPHKRPAAASNMPGPSGARGAAPSWRAHFGDVADTHWSSRRTASPSAFDEAFGSRFGPIPRARHDDGLHGLHRRAADVVDGVRHTRLSAGPELAEGARQADAAARLR